MGVWLHCLPRGLAASGYEESGEVLQAQSTTTSRYSTTPPWSSSGTHISADSPPLSRPDDLDPAIAEALQKQMPSSSAPNADGCRPAPLSNAPPLRKSPTAQSACERRPNPTAAPHSPSGRSDHRPTELRDCWAAARVLRRIGRGQSAGESHPRLYLYAGRCRRLQRGGDQSQHAPSAAGPAWHALLLCVPMCRCVQLPTDSPSSEPIALATQAR